MIDTRLQKIDEALGAMGSEALSGKAALWRWAYREMLHETLTGMHQLAHLLGIADQVAAGWRAPVDIDASSPRFLAPATLADRRLPAVRGSIDDVAAREVRVAVWRAEYARLVAATLRGMHALAGKHRIVEHTAASWLPC